MSGSISKIVDHGFFGGMFWREHYFYKKGDVHKGHTHELDHATILIKGSLKVNVEGEEPYEVSAPSVIEISREIMHEFTALEDNTIYMCVFATDKYEETLFTMSKEQKANFLKRMLCKDCEGCSEK